MNKYIELLNLFFTLKGYLELENKHCGIKELIEQCLTEMLEQSDNIEMAALFSLLKKLRAYTALYLEDTDNGNFKLNVCDYYKRSFHQLTELMQNSEMSKLNI